MKLIDGPCLAVRLKRIESEAEAEIQRLRVGFWESPPDPVRNDRIIRMMDIQRHLEKATRLAMDYK